MEMRSGNQGIKRSPLCESGESSTYGEAVSKGPSSPTHAPSPPPTISLPVCVPFQRETNEYIFLSPQGQPLWCLYLGGVGERGFRGGFSIGLGETLLCITYHPWARIITGNYCA